MLKINFFSFIFFCFSFPSLFFFSITLTLYKYLLLNIKSTSDEDIKENLQFIYNTLKPFFEKKQIKDQLDAAEKLGSISLDKLHNKEFEEAKRYF